MGCCKYESEKIQVIDIDYQLLRLKKSNKTGSFVEYNSFLNISSRELLTYIWNHFIQL